jgi:hypothetical protein
MSAKPSPKNHTGRVVLTVFNILTVVFAGALYIAFLNISAAYPAASDGQFFENLGTVVALMFVLAPYIGALAVWVAIVGIVDFVAIMLLIRAREAWTGRIIAYFATLALGAAAGGYVIFSVIQNFGG